MYYVFPPKSRGKLPFLDTKDATKEEKSPLFFYSMIFSFVSAPNSVKIF